MSHTSIHNSVLIKNPLLLCQIAARINGAKFQIVEKEQEMDMTYNKVKGIASIKLPDWRIPLVITSAGEIVYDNFRAKPLTSMQTFGRLLQTYVEENIIAEYDKSIFELSSKKKDRDGNIIIELEEY